MLRYFTHIQIGIQTAIETVLFEDEQSSFMQLTTRVSSLYPVTAKWCVDPTWNDPNFGSAKIAPKAKRTTYMLKLDIFRNPKFWAIPSWVTTPHGCHWLQWTDFGKQFQNWISFIFIQLQLKGIVTKESSPRTNDLYHISGRINEICTSFEFGYPLLYVPISDSWHFVNINLNA